MGYRRTTNNAWEIDGFGTFRDDELLPVVDRSLGRLSVVSKKLGHATVMQTYPEGFEYR